MSGTLDLSFSEDQEAIRAAVDRFCTQHSAEDFARQSATPFPRELWRELAALGVFSAAAPGNTDAGGAQEVCAISEPLGHHTFPGPIGATFTAIQLLDTAKASGVIDGGTLVSLSSADSTLLPWGTEADLFLVVDGANISSASAPQQVTPVPTLAGETWGRAKLSIEHALPGAGRGLTLGNIATAAYLSAAAWRLVKDASEHAATRKQFGRSLGEFQAVTHPLADCAIGVTAAQTLARAAACSYDSIETEAGQGLEEAQCYAAGALMSARRASLHAAYVCHQVFAGIGITLEGPAFHVSRRIRQLASTPPAGTREQELLLDDAGLGV